MTARGLRIAIIGGLTLALVLRQRRMQADVYQQAAELAEAGAAVAMSADATWEPRRLGILDPITAASCEPTERISRDGHTGTRIAAHPVREGRAYRARFGAPRYGIHRTDLQRALGGTLAGKGLHLGHRLSDLAEAGDAMRPTFDNGHTAKADLKRFVTLGDAVDFLRAVGAEE